MMLVNRSLHLPDSQQQLGQRRPHGSHLERFVVELR